MWSFEGIADKFLPASEKGGASPYLLRKRVFVFANIIQLLVTLVALATIPFFVGSNYPLDKLSLLCINLLLSGLFLAAVKSDIDFERTAFFYANTFLINVSISVWTSGGGLSYMVSWYVVIAVANGFFLRGWKRSVAFIQLEIVVLVLLAMSFNGYHFEDTTTGEYRGVLAAGSTLLAVLFCAALGLVNSSLSGSHERVLADQAHTDPLTGLLNRRGFLLHVQQQKTGSLLLLDVDHFKAFNDTYGHDAGDKVLVHLAAKVQATIRDNDRVVRLGGEEFAIWFHGAAPEQLAGVVDRIRTAIADPIAVVDESGSESNVSVKVSGGLVACRPQEALEDTVSRADKLLYQAKSAGRNQVIFDTALA